MKKFAVSLLIGLGLLTAEAQAAGPYDGIWVVTYFGLPAGYYSAHEKDGTLIAVGLPDDSSSWEALMGPRNGNAVDMSTLVGGVNAQVTVTFTYGEYAPPALISHRLPPYFVGILAPLDTPAHARNCHINIGPPAKL